MLIRNLKKKKTKFEKINEAQMTLSERTNQLGQQFEKIH